MKSIKIFAEFTFLFSVLFGLMRIEDAFRKLTNLKPIPIEKESI